VRNNKLKELIMDKNHLEGKKLRVLREAMMNNLTIKFLSLNQCDLGEEGTYFIA
jgi:hypothetical protein